MARHGMNAATGQLLSGWPHVVQSIGVILTTRLATRVMRRTFGSRLKELQDAPGNRRTLLEVYAAVADALAKWEPGFRLQTVELTRAGPDGVYAFVLTGIYYPRGHLGDFTLSEPATTRLPVAVNDNGYVVVGVAA
jgi:phage baseplate assembly protein W